MEDSPDWCVDCSDDEDKYGLNGCWEPPNEEVIKLYKAIASGEELILDWKCHGRRLPQTGKKSKPTNSNENVDKNQSSHTNATPASPSGYEFDLDDAAGPVTPSRVPRIPGKTPKSAQKRVARFDRVINDINRQKLGSPVASPDSPAVSAPSPSTATTTTTTSTNLTVPASTTYTSDQNSKPINQQFTQLKLQQAATEATPTSSPQQTNPS